MDKDKIIDYVMNSPQNTNRAVLNSMLDDTSSGGGGSDIAIIRLDLNQEGTWSCNYTYDGLFEIGNGNGGNGTPYIIMDGAQVLENGMLSLDDTITISDVDILINRTSGKITFVSLRWDITEENVITMSRKDVEVTGTIKS